MARRYPPHVFYAQLMLEPLSRLSDVVADVCNPVVKNAKWVTIFHIIIWVRTKIKV